MAEPFIGEIRMLPYQFAPRGWTYCDGQLMHTKSYTKLFSILRTKYGGNGDTTFAVPDLRGRSPLHSGIGSGLTKRSLAR